MARQRLPRGFLSFSLGWRRAPGLQAFAWVAACAGFTLAFAALGLSDTLARADQALSGRFPDAGRLLVSKPGGGGFDETEIAGFTGLGAVRAVHPVRANTFRPMATVGLGDRRYSSEIFFESLPDAALPERPPAWDWEPGMGQPVPILIPRDFLNLYNLGFAPARGLPQLDAALLTIVPIGLELLPAGPQGHGALRLAGRVVGTTDQLTTILVPDSFLAWANRACGRPGEAEFHRLVLDTAGVDDPLLRAYLRDGGYLADQGGNGLGPALAALRTVLAALAGLGAVLVVLAFAVLGLVQSAFLARQGAELRLLTLLGHNPNHLAFRAGAVGFAGLAAAVGLAQLAASAVLGPAAGLLEAAGASAAAAPPWPAGLAVAASSFWSIAWGYRYRQALLAEES